MGVAPEVRQCQDPDSKQFGWVALRVDLPAGPWLVSTTDRGGHYGKDSEVEDWKVLE